MTRICLTRDESSQQIVALTRQDDRRPASTLYTRPTSSAATASRRRRQSSVDDSAIDMQRPESELATPAPPPEANCRLPCLSSQFTQTDLDDKDTNVILR